MDIGICVASHIGDIDYIVEAERLGYSSAWLADSQMIWSDCYATLALAASRTERIRLGTGVAVAGTRPPAVNAAGIATINAIAPGRTFFGVGAGNTALRIMGQPPMPIAAFDRYLGEIRPLLRGEESTVRIRNRAVPIRHIMPDRGFVNFEQEIPMYVSGFGPRSLGLAGKHGDGAVLGFPGNPVVLEGIWNAIEAGASAAGRTIHRNDYYLTALTTISILDAGEDAGSPRIKRECGAMAMAGLHYAYDQVRQLHREPPAYASDTWPEYTAMLDAVPAERLHQRIHAGHNCWVIPEEERFVTKALIERGCVVGTKEEVIDRLRALQAAGLDQVMILPSFDARYELLERVARDVIPNV
jgi:alkanesulfonate monooxygenase SsuD/methylene tetrahydromethanopterin reductase-like flavin-dependent oxidoreductase (luciferase family)